jgi:hypothetical protein
MATDIVAGKTNSSFIQTQIDFHNKNSKSVSDKDYLDLAIADFIHSNGLAFRIVEDNKFKRLLHYAHITSTSYQPPKRKQVSENLLDELYDNYVNVKKNLLQVEVEKYGLAIMGDGATIKKTTF